MTAVIGVEVEKNESTTETRRHRGGERLRKPKSLVFSVPLCLCGKNLYFGYKTVIQWHIEE